MTSRHEQEFAEYAAARMPSLRRLAMLLCHDWHGADDLVQVAITKLYLHWASGKSDEPASQDFTFSGNALDI